MSRPIMISFSSVAQSIVPSINETLMFSPCHNHKYGLIPRYLNGRIEPGMRDRFTVNAIKIVSRLHKQVSFRVFCLTLSVCVLITLFMNKAYAQLRSFCGMHSSRLLIALVNPFVLIR